MKKIFEYIKNKKNKNAENEEKNESEKQLVSAKEIPLGLGHYETHIIETEEGNKPVIKIGQMKPNGLFDPWEISEITANKNEKLVPLNVIKQLFCVEYTKLEEEIYTLEELGDNESKKALIYAKKRIKSILVKIERGVN